MSSWRISSCGERWNQRCPPWSFGRESQASDSAWMRPSGNSTKILLQGIQAEGVFHLEGGELAVRAVGLDDELVAVAEEARVQAEIVSKLASLKSPSTVSCWYAPWHARAAIRARASPPRARHEAQVSLPTKLRACAELAPCGGLADVPESGIEKTSPNHDRRGDAGCDPEFALRRAVRGRRLAYGDALHNGVRRVGGPFRLLSR